VDAKLNNILYVPKLDKNLFLLIAMTRQGYSIGKPAGTIHFTKNGRTDVSTIFDGNFYIMQLYLKSCQDIAQTNDLYVWHKRWSLLYECCNKHHQKWRREQY